MTLPTQPKLATRSANSTKHPGKAHQRYDRKSTTVVQAELAEKAAEKSAKASSMAAGIKKAAGLKNSAKEKELLAKKNTGASARKLTIPRSTRTRTKSDNSGPTDGLGDGDIDEGTAEKPERRKIKQIIYEDEDEDEHDVVNPTSHEHADDIQESGSSGSEYKSGEEEVEEDEFEDEELENDAPDTDLRKAQQAPSQKKKKEKQGIIARRKVRDARDQLASHSTTAPDSDRVPTAVKRKAASHSTDLAPPKKQKNGIPDGLTPGWDSENILLPAPNPSVKRSKSATSSSSLPPSSSSRGRGHSVDEDSASENNGASSAFKDGGILSDAEESSYHGHTSSGKSTGSRYRSIAKVEDIADAPKIVRRNQVSRKRPTYQNLPAAGVKLFDVIKVLAIDTAGTNDPWEPLSDDQITGIWNKFFEDDHPIACEDNGVGSVELFKIVQKLINRAISQWIHRFGLSATEALKSEYRARGLNSDEDRATFVLKMLGKEDQTDKNRPFLWKSTDETMIDGKLAGLFLGRMVLQTLSEHFVFLSHVKISPQRHDYELSLKPRGALMLAIQAVHRALLYSVNGSFEPPTGPKEGEFSRANWGDIEEEMKAAAGKRTRRLIKRASTFKARIDSLTDTHWAAIVNGAKERMSKKRGHKKKAEEVDDVVVVDDDGNEDDDDLLFDPMFA